MALPASGEISFALFNTDRGIAFNTQIDMATAGNVYGVSYVTNGSNDLRMDEFYGKSAGGTTTTTTLAPTTTTTTAAPTTTTTTAAPTTTTTTAAPTTTTTTAAPTTTTTTAAPTTTTTTTTTTTYLPYGTYISEYCDYVNFNKIGVFADGSGGTYDSIIAYNDPTCGYVAPTTAAPTTTTTTTTTAFPGYFYLAEKYDCGTCTYQGDYIVKSDVPLSTMSYYSTDGNYSYKIMYSASAQAYDNDLTYYTYTDGASCAEACANY